MSSKVLGPIAACLFVSLTSLGCAAEIVVPARPPAERVETVGAAPSAEHFWIRGHWQWDGREYAWVPGQWETRRATHVYQAGHWRDTGRGWTWVEGRWVQR
jgi:hypothetical protein